ncbi:MAG: SpoIIE family protein phosphatase [Planctomycetota bacterium]|nr:SpoIIE family protein phosphatase [Planctomycetota bacterium]
MTEQGREAELRLEPIGSHHLGPFVLSGEVAALIGRAEECAVCLPDPAVSRRHAQLARRGAYWLLTDLESRHGTFLNGIRLQPRSPAVVAEGDVLRLGSCTLRAAGQPGGSAPLATIDDAASPDTIVQRVPEREIDSVAHRRLELFINGATAIHQAQDEATLARAVLELVLSGTGFPRAAVLRHVGATEQVELVAGREAGGVETTAFAFSRSLLQEAAGGHMARLSRSSGQAYGQSIERLGITQAVAAPILLDAVVVGYVYLDARESERPGDADAAGFCHAVARLAGLALSSLKRAELEARQKQLDADLRAAQLAQEFLCPKERGMVGPLSFAAQTCPGRIVAGDLFDIFELDRDRVALCCGDVTGQGMGAAIMMTAILAHLRAALAHDGEPEEAVNDVNRYIAPRSPAHMFASLWVAVLDRRDGVLRYVDAGHGHWLLRRRGKAPAPGPSPAHLLVGIEAEYRYDAARLELHPGDRLILYSDGIIEHRDAAGEEFGHDRLIDAVAASASPDADVVDALTALRKFVGEAAFADDTTIASIEYTDAAIGEGGNG